MCFADNLRYVAMPHTGLSPAADLGLSSHLVCILWVEEPQGHALDSIGTELTHLKQLSRPVGVRATNGMSYVVSMMHQMRLSRLVSRRL